jgi:hypothetical protein
MSAPGDAGTITHVHAVDPPGVEYAAEAVQERESVVYLRGPIVFRQRGSSEFTLLAGIHALSLPYANVRRIEVWDAQASEV